MRTTALKTLAAPILAGALSLLVPLPAGARQLFGTADGCMACHNGLSGPTGDDLSIGFAWRPSMMANSARDPYWQAGVRREVMEHPQARAAIEDKCSRCHMPMANFSARAGGKQGHVFAHLPVGQRAGTAAALAADGVSCTACHQITDRKLGSVESFTGGFVVDTTRPWGEREVFGPFRIDRGRARVMRSAAELNPVEAKHLRRSEVCATCHTLYTHALGPTGKVVGELPEQVPYLEWRHSAYRTVKSCQDCHMPSVAGAAPIASVLGQPREGFSSHAFRGGNFLMPRLLNRHREELGVQALPQEQQAAARRTVEHLQTRTASLSIPRAEVRGGRLEAEVVVANLAGHKLPTAYPSRRAWLHLTVRDRDGKRVFESGALAARGSIAGNDNDADGRRYEPHHGVINRPDQVQIYESVMTDHGGAVTTGLLKGVRYVKDNRLLPRGFDKRTAHPDVAVRGSAAGDPDFAAGEDRVQYHVRVDSGRGPFSIEVELWYQPIGYRWAQNLRRFKAVETARFTSAFASMGSSSALRIASCVARAEPRQPEPPPAPQPSPTTSP